MRASKALIATLASLDPGNAPKLTVVEPFEIGVPLGVVQDGVADDPCEVKTCPAVP